MDLTPIQGFSYGVLGGIFAELAGVFELRRQAASQLPRWVRSPLYWTITAGMILAGGAVAWIYIGSGVDLSPLLAVNVGASAPLILARLGAQPPPIPPGRTN
jgi:hypothetical protein